MRGFRVYEDRQRHVTSFEAFFSSYVKNNCRRPVAPRGPLAAQVVHVVEKAVNRNIPMILNSP